MMILKDPQNSWASGKTTEDQKFSTTSYLLARFPRLICNSRDISQNASMHKITWRREKTTSVESCKQEKRVPWNSIHNPPMMLKKLYKCPNTKATNTDAAENSEPWLAFERKLFDEFHMLKHSSAVLPSCKHTVTSINESSKYEAT